MHKLLIDVIVLPSGCYSAEIRQVTMTTTISGARMASALKIKDGSRSSVSPTSGTEPASPWTLQKGATFSARLTNFGKETFGFAKKSMPWLPDVNVPKALPISRFRATIFEILDNSASSIAAFIVYVIVMCFIMISIITFCMGTDPANRMRQERNVIDDADRALERVETAVVIAFTVEYLARLVTCTAVPDPHEVDPLTYLREKERHHQAITPADIAGLPPSYPGWIGAKNVMPVLIDGIIRLSSFIFSPLNVIDVAAVVPYYVQLIMPTETGSSLAILRVLRLARVLRVLRLSRRSAGFRLLSRTMELSMDALAMLAYIIALGVVLFGSMVFYCEGKSHTRTHTHTQCRRTSTARHDAWVDPRSPSRSPASPDRLTHLPPSRSFPVQLANGTQSVTRGCALLWRAPT